MKRTLVTKGEIDPYICTETKTFYADETMIIAPGAMDELKRRGVKLVRGERPAPKQEEPVACADQNEAGLQELLVSVAALVKAEFGVEDPELLKAISCQAVKTIRENI